MWPADFLQQANRVLQSLVSGGLACVFGVLEPAPRLFDGFEVWAAGGEIGAKIGQQQGFLQLNILLQPTTVLWHLSVISQSGGPHVHPSLEASYNRTSPSYEYV